jgi:hypothetical protein
MLYIDTVENASSERKGDQSFAEITELRHLLDAKQSEGIQRCATL